MSAISVLSRGVLCALIRAYQWVISPLFPGTCRFYPTCSSYAVEAISRHGGMYGLWLAGRRILRCHPWGAAGVDPVPDAPARPACCNRPPAQ